MADLRFPQGFLWGAATAAHQVEGNNSASDWWTWERSGRIGTGEVSGRACEQYQRFDQDFRLASELGHSAHRFGIEWSRIEPEPGHYSQEAVEHYRQVLASLRRHNLVPIVTLWHFTLPAWLARRGGWEWRGAVPAFERFVEHVANELGDGVPYWCTVNEPNVYLLQSYFLGIWPPQQRSILRCIRVHRGMVAAHRAAYAVLKRRRPESLVGFAGNFHTVDAERPDNPFDRLAARIAGFFWNDWFTRQVVRQCDFIGVNYYFPSNVRFAPTRPDLFFADIRDPMSPEHSDLGWPILPEGFGRAVDQIARYGKPLLITENGLADADDSRRPNFIVQHLAALHRSIQSGADVRAYLHWSLIDNFEWAYGFSPRFGLAQVDYATQKRTPRPSALLYRDIIRANGLEAGLLARHEKTG